MIIFAKKHFSSKNASLFSFLIKLAIYFRAGVAITNRLVKKSILPIFDASLLFFGILGFKSIWEEQIKGFRYPNEFLYYIIPSITLIIMASVAFCGGYRNKVKLNKVLNGVLLVQFQYLLVTALLMKNIVFQGRLLALVRYGQLWHLSPLASFFTFLNMEILKLILIQGRMLELLGKRKK